MSIPYLPGWWDMLNQNGAVTNVVKGIDKRMRPDAYANQNLQQAIQQNPMLLDQISNMDPTQRQMLASGFGFRNENPFGGIAEGQKIKDQKEMDSLKASMTPEAKQEYNANKLGVKTDTERKAQNLSIQKLEQDIQNGMVSGKLNALKLNELERESKRLESVLTKTAPDVAAVARSVVAGRSIDPQTAERIGADPYLKATYDDYVRSLQLRMQTDASKYIASLKTPVEKQLGLDALKVQIMQTQQQLTEATNFTSGRDGMLNQMSYDPAVQETYKNSLTMIPTLRKRIEQLNQVYVNNLKKLGMDIPADMQFLTGEPAPQQKASPLAPKVPLSSLSNQFFGPPR